MQHASGLPVTKLERSAQYFLLAALFCVPFSTWLTNLFIGLTLFAFVPALVSSAALRASASKAPALLALALLALLVLGAAWSIAPNAELVHALKKYARLLLLPVAVGLALRNGAMPERARYAFLGGAAMVAASSYLVWAGHMPTSSQLWWRVGDSHDSFAFKNHITIGILIGFAASASLLAATYAGTLRARLAWLAGAIWFVVPVMFLTQGRSGYVAVFVGLVTVFLLRVRLTPLRFVGGLAAIILLFAGFYATSDNFQSRTSDLITEVENESLNKANGLRLAYMRTGLNIVADHPLMGIGTGAFATAFAPTANAVWAKGTSFGDVRHQPHSEFLLIAVQLGLPGLLCYFAMLGALLRPALASRSLESDSLVLLWAIYVVSSSYNSLLWDTTEAHWFLLLGGCLYAAACARGLGPGPGRGRGLGAAQA